ncbi:MAG: ATP-dependent RNA helicase [Spirochaetales bacterium]|nr:ATP-dependent RNA helicase [Spirochaetales bacterium]
MNPLELPVYQQKERILAALADHQVIVVESPTGSGKTTQIPQILLEAGYGASGRGARSMIGVTQPRRIAAVSVCGFIARQRGVTIPEVVGYKMRFEDRTDLTTRIKIMTDGILLQEMKADPALSRYGVMMVDEAHERSLNIDFILGLLKRVLENRPEFKVVVSSATINAEVFSEYFDECPIVNIETEPYPVRMIYAPPASESSPDALLEQITRIVYRIETGQPVAEDEHGGPAPEEAGGGDVLVFLPGEGSIKNCITALQGLPVARRLEILPLYSRLSSEEQERVFQDYPGRRKVVVATNIAETSVTIDGITTVIDSGRAKMNFYNNRNFTSSLVEVPVSKASANQRRGRAGRTRPGVCYRLYSRKDFDSRPLFTTEEILRTDLSEVVLRMAELGIQDFESFDFISPPEREGILSAIETLKLLDALDEQRALTQIGEQMLAFPILPRLARMIVEAIRHYPGVLEEILIAAAFLSARTPFVLPPGEELEARKAHHSFRDPLGDFVSYLKVFRAFRKTRDREGFCRRNYLDERTLAEILNIERQLEEIVAEQGIPIGSGGELSDYLCAAARGLIQFVCVRSGRGVYRTLTAGRIQIHPGSVMFREDPLFIVAGEIVRTSRMWAHSVSPLKRAWLERIHPLLARQLGGEGKGKGREGPLEIPGKPRRREGSDFIKIGWDVFDIRMEKGKKKTVILPWEKIRPVTASPDLRILPSYHKLKGKLLYQDYELFSGMRLSTILRLVPKVDLEAGIMEQAPAETLCLPEGYERLAARLKDLLRVCRIKRKQKRLGFLTLHTDGQGSYWFKGTRNYITALNESLYSLETLADAPATAGKPAQEINRAYRQLARTLEEL